MSEAKRKAKKEIVNDLEDIAPVVIGFVISDIMGYLACKYQYL